MNVDTCTVILFFTVTLYLTSFLILLVEIFKLNLSVISSGLLVNMRKLLSDSQKATSSSTGDTVFDTL